MALQEKIEALSARISRGQKRGLILGLRGAEGEVLVTPGSLKRFGEEMERYLSTFHASHPALPGAPTDQTLAKVFPRMNSRLARSVAAAWADRGGMVSEEGRLRLRDFVPQDLEKLDRWLEELESESLNRGMQFLSVEEARQHLGISEKEMDLVLQQGREQHRLSIMGEQMLLFKEMERRVLDLLEGMGGDLTLAAVRDASGSTRKYILPLLEHLDARGITRRVGDKRILRKRPPENT
ncbi:MAG: Selenocysteine-specific elongation factor [Synergistetes bacterium ADurb.Bin520]|nr:MAG: Selenocysteine-specific elongation factor [Synergistetes bacterium ADurb.Bin520]